MQQHNIDIYNRYVREYMDRFMDLGLYRQSFDHLLRCLPENATVLELGCGPGNVVKYLLQKRPDLQVLGIDLAPEMIAVAAKENPTAVFKVMDIRDVPGLDQKFDAVIAAFSIPYIQADDLERVFKNFETLTVENGLIYLSCMEGPATRSGFETTSFTGEDQLYISYYERENITERFIAHGFRILEFSTSDYPEADGSVTTDLFFTALKLH